MPDDLPAWLGLWASGRRGPTESLSLELAHKIRPGSATGFKATAGLDEARCGVRFAGAEAFPSSGYPDRSYRPKAGSLVSATFLRPRSKVATPSDRNSTHLAGEYFVAAELYRRGFSVAMTLGNAKAIDLFAERSACTVNVQVKAIRDKKSIGWPIMKERILDGIIYVFVCLNPAGTAPDFFICTSEEARTNTAQYATRGIVDLRKLKGSLYQERWDKIETAPAMPSGARKAVRMPRRATRATKASRPILT